MWRTMFGFIAAHYPQLYSQQQSAVEPLTFVNIFRMSLFPNCLPYTVPSMLHVIHISHDCTRVYYHFLDYDFIEMARASRISILAKSTSLENTSCKLFESLNASSGSDQNEMRKWNIVLMHLYNDHLFMISHSQCISIRAAQIKVFIDPLDNFNPYTIYGFEYTIYWFWFPNLIKFNVYRLINFKYLWFT